MKKILFTAAFFGLFAVCPSFAQDIVKFTENGKRGFKDREGNVVAPAIYSEINDAGEGMFFGEKMDSEKWCLINEKGVQISDFILDFSAHRFSEGFCGYTLTNNENRKEMGYMNRKGEAINSWVLPEPEELKLPAPAQYYLYRVSPDIRKFNEGVGMAGYSVGYKHLYDFEPTPIPGMNIYAFIDTAGQVWAQINGVAEIGNYSNGLVRITLETDENGNKIETPCLFVKPDAEQWPLPSFSAARDFSEGMAAAAVPDPAGGRTLDVTVTSIFFYVTGGPSQQFNNKWGYVNTSGEWVVKPVYDLVEDFRNGYGWASVYGDKYEYDYPNNVKYLPLTRHRFNSKGEIVETKQEKASSWIDEQKALKEEEENAYPD